MKSIYFSGTDILQLEPRLRAALINSLSGFKSASLIGTIDNKRNTNLAIFSSVFHLGSNPAFIGFVIRPDSVSRHTLENLLETKCFTINHINKDIYKRAHQTSARYPKNISEFDSVGLTMEFGKRFLAPYVKESKIKYGLELAERLDLKMNGTVLIIGKVVELIIPENCFLTNGAIDIEKAESIAISGLDSYHSTKLLSRLTYAKPEKLPEEIL